MLGQTEFYSLTHHSKNQPLKFYLSNLLKIVSISGSFPGLKRFGRFAEPLNRTSNLPNLLFGPKNRTSNLPNLKKPNEPPKRTSFVPSLLMMQNLYSSENWTSMKLFTSDYLYPLAPVKIQLEKWHRQYPKMLICREQSQQKFCCTCIRWMDTKLICKKTQNLAFHRVSAKS